jgi:tRNA-Thr(GGU) m(6)t(6)A37 methyltransferase TsaA
MSTCKDPTKIVIEPIGIVHSPIKEGRDHKWGEVVSEIHITNTLKKGVQGLDAFSHIVVVFYMHKASFCIKEDLMRHPRGRDDMPLVGIFAQQAKHRPNPIGVSVVRLVDIKEGVLVVKGLDAIDGTPVIDIKPYFPIFDQRNDVVVPVWVNILMEDYF